MNFLSLRQKLFAVYMKQVRDANYNIIPFFPVLQGISIKNLLQKLIPECFISTLFQMAVLIPFHFFHFHLNFHGSDFFLFP